MIFSTFYRRTDLYRALLVVVLLASNAIGRDDGVLWVWSGAVTARSTVVKAKLNVPADRARLHVAENPRFDGARLLEPTHQLEDGVVSFSLTGLDPKTEYHYAVAVDGERRLAGRFLTFAEGPLSFRLVFGSCASTGSNHRIFTTMKELEPLFVLHMGDFHYENIGDNDPDAFRDAFDEVLTEERQSALYRSAPIAYVWDDHDYGPNNADRTSPSRPAALEVYREVVPHYPLVRHDGEVETIQQAFTVGRVRFLLTDVRAARDPAESPDGAGKSMLGQRQRAWFLDELEATRNRYALVVWVNVVPWITKKDPDTDEGWAPYSHERRTLADAIKELDLVDRFLILSGDAHMLAIDDGTHSNYATDHDPNEPAFPVMHAAPLDRYPRAKGGPYSHGVVAERSWWNPLDKDQQFGLMEVRDDGETLDVTLSGRDGDGEVFPGMVLRMRCRAEGCEVLSPDRPEPPAQ